MKACPGVFAPAEPKSALSSLSAREPSCSVSAESAGRSKRKACRSPETCKRETAGVPAPLVRTGGDSVSSPSSGKPTD